MVDGIYRTWGTSAALAVAAYAVCESMQFTTRNTVLAVGLALYLPSYLDGSEHTGKRYWPWFAAQCRQYAASVPATLLMEEEATAKTQQHLYCCHPHGLMALHPSILSTGSSTPPLETYSPMRTRRNLAASVVFRMPLYREYLLWTGCVDAQRAVAEKMLNEGNDLVIVVGGIAEQMLSQRGDHTIYVKKRKGHIRLSLKYGIPIVPVYAFGETDLYTHSDMLLSFRQKLSSKFSFAFIIGYGSSKLFPLAPHKDVKVNLVGGKPIPVKQSANPTAEEIDELHAQYVAELERIFNTYKERYGYKDKTLHIC